MKTLMTILVAMWTVQAVMAQVGINTDTPHPSAALEIKSDTAGILFPRVNNLSTISNPVAGLVVYQSSDNSFYYFNGGWWSKFNRVQNILADYDGDTNIKVEKYHDEDFIRFDLGGSEKMTLRGNSEGFSRLEFPNNANNILLGENAGSQITSGAIHNIGIGKNVLNALTAHDFNIAIGSGSLQNTTKGNNVAIGLDALNANVGGSANIAIGHNAGKNETGSNRLYIENSSADSSHALIYGEFDNNILMLNGRVAIGSPGSNSFATDTDYKLSVNGKVVSEEIRVRLKSNWPDYVFSDQYELKPLRELEKEIEVLGHLPGIPSADVIEGSGLDMGEMVKLQMEKIEELTLYIIELEKKMTSLQSELKK